MSRLPRACVLALISTPLIVVECTPFSSAPIATATDAAVVDALVPAADAKSSDGGDCVGKAGPRGIRVDAGPASFCIDATEVTVGDYAAFVAAVGADTGGQPQACAWNSTYIAGDGRPGSDPTLPVVSVDWCDAYAYCTWAGKRLCGRLGGGPVDPSQDEDPSAGEWTFACTAGGARGFPYGGSVYDAAPCDTNGDAAVDVGSDKACVGGFPGIYDMSGNVEEWVDSCSPNGLDPSGATDSCRRRGGSWKDGPVLSNYMCETASLNTRNLKSNDTGFRCCSP